MQSAVKKFLIPLLLALSVTACSHYQLGTAAKLQFHALYVEPVAVAKNVSLPQAREIVSAQIREAFLHDARVTLVNAPESADATLTVVLTDYHRDVTSVREGDTGLARKFTLTLGATCTLSDNRGATANKTFFDHRPVSVQREAYTDSGQLQSEYQTLPLLAESLAGKITHTVLDVW